MPPVSSRVGSIVIQDSEGSTKFIFEGSALKDSDGNLILTVKPKEVIDIHKFIFRCNADNDFKSNNSVIVASGYQGYQGEPARSKAMGSLSKGWLGTLGTLIYIEILGS